MKLKVGDRIIENDGICVLVYEIVKIEGKKAIGRSDFEEKSYYTAYRSKQEDPDDIKVFIPVQGDYTIRKLAK